MKKSTVIWTIVIIVVIIVGIVIYNNSQSQSSTTATTTAADQTASLASGSNPTSLADTTSTPPGTVVLSISSTNSTLGKYLTAPNGMTLYQYSKDTTGVSNCTGTCATAWPPYTITSTSSTTLLEGDKGMTGIISTLTRADGTVQVAYNGMPLYFFKSDASVGAVTGQNVNGFTVVQP